MADMRAQGPESDGRGERMSPRHGRPGGLRIERGPIAADPGAGANGDWRYPSQQDIEPAYVPNPRPTRAPGHLAAGYRHERHAAQPPDWAEDEAQDWADDHWRNAEWPQAGWPGDEAGTGTAPNPRALKVQRAVNMAGAAVSLLLLVGLGWWGYRLAVRDMSGVPVIRALEGPARIAPEDPGGELAEHTGFSVNEVAADGIAAPAAEQLHLAPAPVGLSEEDVTMGRLEGATARPGVPHGRVDPVDPDALRGKTPREPLPDEAPEPLLAGPGDIAGIDAAVAMAIQSIPESVPGVKRSPRPPVKPGAMLIPTLADLPKFRDVDAASLAAGTRLVQLGAFDTEAGARDEWNRIALEYGPLMNGKGRVIQQAESGGKIFYRLRAEGFADLADARRFCAAIVRPDMRCIPVQVR